MDFVYFENYQGRYDDRWIALLTYNIQGTEDRMVFL